MKQNPGKIGPLIQAVLEVTSAPARFWDRGARWFVARFDGLWKLETSFSVFLDEIRWLFGTRPVMMSCQEKVSPSRAARGYTNWREERRSRRHGDSRRDWSLGANGCRGASWSNERFGPNSLTATPQSGLLLSGRLRTSRTPDPLISMYMVCWKVYSCTAVSSTVTCHVTLLYV